MTERMSAAEYRDLIAKPKGRGQTRKRLEAPRNRPAVDEIVVELPVPPTANHCWVNVAGAGRVRSPEYRRWHKGAAQEAALARGRIEGRYTIRIQLGKLPHGSDVGNRTKPTVDLLAGLLTDDDVFCVREIAEWASDCGIDVPPNRMRITVARSDQ